MLSEIWYVWNGAFKGYLGKYSARVNKLFIKDRFMIGVVNYLTHKPLKVRKILSTIVLVPRTS